VRGAYALLLQLIEKPCDDLPGRLRRSYAFRLLPYLSVQEPTLRAEIEGLLENHSRNDPDPYARCLAVSCLMNHPVIFQEVLQAGCWFVDTTTSLRDGSSRLDEVRLPLSPELERRLSGLVQEFYGREQDTITRNVLVRYLAARRDPALLPVLAEVLSKDRTEDTRYWALTGISRLPVAPETRTAIYDAFRADPSERIRAASCSKLVDVGVVDPLIVNTLLGQEERDFVMIGRAYAVLPDPQLSAALRQGLESQDQNVRVEAIRGVGRTGDPAFLPFLRDRLASEAQPGVRGALEEVIQLLPNRQ
jgi:hypothetical protein